MRHSVNKFLMGVIVSILFLAISCSKDSSPTKSVDPPIVIKPQTKVLADSVVTAVKSISADGSVLDFGTQTPGINDLKVNDVIVSSFNRGMARLVTNIQKGSSDIIITTTQASLTDIFQEAHFELKRAITTQDIDSISVKMPGAQLSLNKSAGGAEDVLTLSLDGVVLFDDDGNLSTTSDQIRLNGSYSAKPSIEFNASIRSSRLSELMFKVSMDEELELELETGIDVIEIKEKKLIGDVHLHPIVVWAGFVPVVLTPTIGLYAGFDGSVTATVTTGIVATSASSLGVWFKDNRWSLIKDHTNDFTSTPPTLSLGIEAKAYAGPEYNLLIYGVVGPYVGVHGYLSLEADLLATPWWELFAGIEATGGVKVQVLDKIIVDEEFPLFLDYRKLLAAAATGAEGEVSGVVKDAVTNEPIVGANLEFSKAGSVVITGQTDALGSYKIAVPVGDDYTISISKEGYLTEVYYSFAINSVTTYFLQTVLQISDQYSGTGTVGGRIVNALDGTGVPNLNLEIRHGMNSTTGPVVASTVTNAYGNYVFTNLSAGSYTGLATGTGFSPTSFTIICIGNQSVQNPDATITPILVQGETRIILTWGSTPEDLDSHLFGPLPDGTSFHLYYPWAESRYGSPWPDYVKLDLDDVTSYGPETITIYQQLDGVYTYKVHDFTNRDYSANTALSTSGAQVRVYQGSTLVAAFNVPSNAMGTVWTVFTLHGTTLTPVNSMSYDPDILGSPSGNSSSALSKLNQKVKSTLP